jgi:hypothetical protein
MALCWLGETWHTSQDKGGGLVIKKLTGVSKFFPVDCETWTGSDGGTAIELYRAMGIVCSLVFL